jgi:acyl-CoA thioester hydrolase
MKPKIFSPKFLQVNMKKDFDLTKFKHRIKETVKFHEVDLLGVCNNAVYFNYFEDARLGFAKEMVAKFKLEKFFQDKSFFIMAHNEADYFKPAFLDDELTVLTRVEFVRTSSYGYEHLILKDSTGEVITHGRGIVVHIDKETKVPSPLPYEIIDAIKQHEDDVQFYSD